MNHAHATRARSIINAHLIRRSSSGLEIFTKVRTTQKRKRRALHERREYTSMGKEEEWPPCDSPFILIVTEPGARCLLMLSLPLGLESTIANDDLCAFVMAAHRQRSPVMLVAGPVGGNQGGEIITGIEGFRRVFLRIPFGFLWDFVPAIALAHHSKIILALIFLWRKFKDGFIRKSGRSKRCKKMTSSNRFLATTRLISNEIKIRYMYLSFEKNQVIGKISTFQRIPLEDIIESGGIKQRYKTTNSMKRGSRL